MFIDVESWGKVAENAQKYLTKGIPVLVEGRIAMQQWVDSARGGLRRTKHLLVAETIQFLPRAA